VNTSSILRRLRAAALVVAIGAGVGGCYELQAAAGEAALMWRREPIARVIADMGTAPALRRQLRGALAIRDFASRELDLPNNGSYRSYADLKRRYVVWNVVAAPEFSLLPKRWCYPLVGCLAYRGYFVQRRALAYARRLRAAGLDVSVQGVAAFSTLGHFDDPILSTMMGMSDVELASIVFHELTHQLIFVAGDTPFDEGLATFVERAGVRRWLESQGRAADLARYELDLGRQAAVEGLLERGRARLAAVYREPLGPNDMRAEKRAQFAALHGEYARLAAGWGRDAPYSGWFRADLNNADLASVDTYERCVPGFARLFAQAGGRFAAFFAQVRAIGAQAPAARDRAVCGAAPSAASSAQRAPRPVPARQRLRRELSSRAPRYRRAEAAIDRGLMPSSANPSSAQTLSTRSER
jgi:predicted aminopeptidase